MDENNININTDPDILEITSEVTQDVTPAPVYPQADDRYAGYADPGMLQNSMPQNGAPQNNSYNYAPIQNRAYSTSYTSQSTGATYTKDSTGAYTAAPGYSYVTAPVYRTPAPAKKRHFPKWLAATLYGILFGVIAAGVFIATNALYSAISADSGSSGSAAVSNLLPFNHSEPGTGVPQGSKYSGNGQSAGLVASTPLITDVNMSATDVSSVVETAMPSIVSIDCTFNTQSFFGVYETSGAGSGIILKQTDTELLIATNNHVVANALSINVTFCNDVKATAVTKGTDSLADLAVISIDISELSADTLAAIKVATLGDSDAVKVGQMVVAIGNAMGYGQSTTVGYVSAKDREVDVDGKTMTLLQTDAAINPGNSGGALLNLDGAVIGINSVKYASDEVEGMGFAIPISRAEAILDELANREILKEEEKGYLGVYLQDVTSQIAAYYNMPIGVYVAELTEGGAAEKAGLQAGDIITAVNGQSVSTSTDLKNAVTSHRAGTTVTLTFERLKRGAYEEMTIDVVLGSNPNLEE